MALCAYSADVDRAIQGKAITRSGRRRSLVPDEGDRPALYRLAAQRICATTRVPYTERMSALRSFARKALPLE